MNQWIVDNADRLNICYVMHTGDIVDDVDMGGEWVNADHSMKIPDDAGMPNGVLAGKTMCTLEWKATETSGSTSVRTATTASLGTEARTRTTWATTTCSPKTAKISGAVHELGHLHRRDQLDESGACAVQPQGHHLLASHQREANGCGLLDYTGKLLQEEVVAKNPNVFAVLNGHYHGASIETSAFDDDCDGVNDRTVYQICTDYQSDRRRQRVHQVLVLRLEKQQGVPELLLAISQ